MISENLKSLMSWVSDPDQPRQWLDCHEIAEMYNISVQSVRIGGQRGCMGEPLKFPSTNKIGRPVTQITNHYRKDRVKAWRDPLVPKE